MDNFRAEITKKLLIYQSLIGLMGLCIVIMAAFHRSTYNNASDFSRGVQIGIFRNNLYDIVLYRKIKKHIKE